MARVLITPLQRPIVGRLHTAIANPN